MRLSVIAVICFVTVLGLYGYEDIPVIAAVSGRQYGGDKPSYVH
jgi:hypothetical protein